MSESNATDDFRPSGSKAVSRSAPSRASAPTMTLRARRRREEAVRRLVADVQSGGGSAAAVDADKDGAIAAETHDWLVASTVATALEKGLDRDLHTELVQEAKDNAGRIGQICHDHADVFLTSVAKVAALGEPSGDLADGLKNAHQELQFKTAGPMMDASLQWEEACQSYAKARTMQVIVTACQKIAVQLERARKHAGLGRPRSALDAVDQARRALATPMETLFMEANIDPGVFKVAAASSGKPANSSTGDSEERKEDTTGTKKSIMVSLDQTPFGKRATIMLPKIENEVLMSARRGLNRWFLALRSGGEQARAGRSVLRHSAYSVSVGTGQLGLGGHLPSSYVWRARTADNLIARIDQNGKVARAVRQGYWFDRDAPKEAERLDQLTKMGTVRRAETIAACFGWFRCWDDNDSLLVDPSEFTFDGDASTRSNMSGSRHGSLSGSRHGSRHGLRGSRHGRRTLGFRATTSSRSQAYQDISSTLGSGATVKTAGKESKWADLLIPSILSDGAAGYVNCCVFSARLKIYFSHNSICLSFQEGGRRGVPGPFRVGSSCSKG